MGFRKSGSFGFFLLFSLEEAESMGDKSVGHKVLSERIGVMRKAELLVEDVFGLEIDFGALGFVLPNDLESKVLHGFVDIDWLWSHTHVSFHIPQLDLLITLSRNLLKLLE